MADRRAPGFLQRSARRIRRERFLFLLVALLALLLLSPLLDGRVRLHQLMNLERLAPGAFKFPESPIGEDRYRFIYFSCVTLASLGYGDMTAATPLAGALTILEAIIGQMYLVVGVGWLVGIYISQKMAARESRGPPLAAPAVSSKTKEAPK